MPELGDMLHSLLVTHPPKNIFRQCVVSQHFDVSGSPATSANNGYGVFVHSAPQPPKGGAGVGYKINKIIINPNHRPPKERVIVSKRKKG